MKKLYSIALAAACATTAAANVTLKADQAVDLRISSFKAESEVLTQKVETETSIGEVILPAQAQAVSSINDLCITYDWSYYSYLNSNSGKQEGEITIASVPGSENQVQLVGFYSTFPVTGTVDLENGTITIAKQFMFTNTYYNKDVYMWYNYWNDNGQGNNNSEDPIVLNINKTTGALTMNEMGNIVIGIPDLGFFLFAGSNEFAPQKEKEFYGQATVTGDMFFSSFVETAPTTYTVDTYKIDDEATMILVKDPLRGLYDALGWKTSTSPDMVIDATYPDNILVNDFSLGINGGDEDGLYYGLSMSANQNDIANTPAAYRITLTKDAEKVIINFPLKSLLLWPSNTTKLYYANTTSAVTITIQTTTSVEDLTVVEEENNAPVEYFTLQGQRVNNPVAGQLLIKRQGAEVSKVLVK